MPPRNPSRTGKISRRKLKNRAQKCECRGWWFPHRAGSRSLNPEFDGCGEPKNIRRNIVNLGSFVCY